MEKITVKKVYRKEITTKNGQATRTSFITEEHGPDYISSLQDGLDGVKEGDVLGGELKINGDFKNFSVKEINGQGMTTKTQLLELRLKALEERVANLENAKAVKMTKEVFTEDVPF
jgi:hypothetical protein